MPEIAPHPFPNTTVPPEASGMQTEPSSRRPHRLQFADRAPLNEIKGARLRACACLTHCYQSLLRNLNTMRLPPSKITSAVLTYTRIIAQANFATHVYAIVTVIGEAELAHSSLQTKVIHELLAQKNAGLNWIRIGELIFVNGI